MDQAHSSFPLTEIAFVVAVAVVLGLFLMRLRLPPLVGFILAGVIMGPTGLGIVANGDNVQALAEMGVLLLLFFIGTELSLKAFVHSLRPALVIVTGQIAVAILIGLAISTLTGQSPGEGIVLGFIIALSSTVVAMKMLDDMDELRGGPGRITVAVLIAQDIAVVPMLIIVSSLGGHGGSVWEVGLKIAVAVIVLAALLWWLGRRGKLQVPFAAQIEDKVELLALGSLAVCFGAAAIAGYAGLSPAYGAFVAGLIIGNSTLRSRVIPVIEPIQAVLLVVFFVSIGLLIDLNYIVRNWTLVLGASLVVIAAKTVLNVFLLRFTGSDRETALISGLSMAQIGEFSFVLAAAGLSAGVLGLDVYRLAIAVTAITLLISPVWSVLMHRIEDMATEGFPSYRAALAEAYASELENVGEGLWWLRVRRRVFRATVKRRRAEREAKRLAKAEAKAARKREGEEAPPGADEPDKPVEKADG